jgi:hypothetical protein
MENFIEERSCFRPPASETIITGLIMYVVGGALLFWQKLKNLHLSPNNIRVSRKRLKYIHSKTHFDNFKKYVDKLERKSRPADPAGRRGFVLEWGGGGGAPKLGVIKFFVGYLFSALVNNTPPPPDFQVANGRSRLSTLLPPGVDVDGSIHLTYFLELQSGSM